MWQVREATFCHNLDSLSSFWKGQSKKKHTIQHNSMFTVLFTHSVFQFCLGAVNRLRHSYIQNETASQCLDALEKNTLKMYISPKWVSRFYSFYDMHDNKKPNTKLFIKKSKMYSRKVRQRHEMDLLTRSISLWALRTHFKHWILSWVFYIIILSRDHADGEESILLNSYLISTERFKISFKDPNLHLSPPSQFLK